MSVFLVFSGQECCVIRWLTFQLFVLVSSIDTPTCSCFTS